MGHWSLPALGAGTGAFLLRSLAAQGRGNWDVPARGHQSSPAPGLTSTGIRDIGTYRHRGLLAPGVKLWDLPAPVLAGTGGSIRCLLSPGLLGTGTRGIGTYQHPERGSGTYRHRDLPAPAGGAAPASGTRRDRGYRQRGDTRRGPGGKDRQGRTGTGTADRQEKWHRRGGQASRHRQQGSSAGGHQRDCEDRKRDRSQHWGAGRWHRRDEGKPQAQALARRTDTSTVSVEGVA